MGFGFGFGLGFGLLLCVVVVEFLFELLGFFTHAFSGGGDVLGYGLCPPFLLGCQGAFCFADGPGTVSEKPDNIPTVGVQRYFKVPSVFML